MLVEPDGRRSAERSGNWVGLACTASVTTSLGAADEAAELGAAPLLVASSTENPLPSDDWSASCLDDTVCPTVVDGGVSALPEDSSLAAWIVSMSSDTGRLVGVGGSVFVLTLRDDLPGVKAVPIARVTARCTRGAGTAATAVAVEALAATADESASACKSLALAGGVQRARRPRRRRTRPSSGAPIGDGAEDSLVACDRATAAGDGARNSSILTCVSSPRSTPTASDSRALACGCKIGPSFRHLLITGKRILSERLGLIRGLGPSARVKSGPGRMPAVDSRCAVGDASNISAARRALGDSPPFASVMALARCDGLPDDLDELEEAVPARHAETT